MEAKTEKMVEKVSSNGRVIIPKKWRESLAIEDNDFVELQLNKEKEIIIRKKVHPLEIDDDLFDIFTPFTDEEIEEAKQSLFPTKKWSNDDENE